MSQAQCQQFYPYYLLSQECCEAGTIIIFRLQMRRQSTWGLSYLPILSVWQEEQLGLNIDSLIPEPVRSPSWH